MRLKEKYSHLQTSCPPGTKLQCDTLDSSNNQQHQQHQQQHQQNNPPQSIKQNQVQSNPLSCPPDQMLVPAEACENKNSTKQPNISSNKKDGFINVRMDMSGNDNIKDKYKLYS
jgi:hypothetical protein